MPNQTRVPLRLAICDDEALDRAQIAQMAQEILRAEEIRAEIFCIAAPRICSRAKSCCPQPAARAGSM